MAKDDFTCGSLDIAIIGMSGRFSGAESVPEWWDKLLAGEEFTQPTCTEDDNGRPQKTIMGTLGLGCAI